MQRKSLMRAGAVALSTLVLLVLSNSASLFGQLNTGKVEGTVRDKDTGQPLAGAQVLVEGTRLGNITNADGYYFILNVPPGLRSITLTFTGYQKTTVTDVLVLAGQTMTVDAGLSSTVVQLEGITVEGESEVLLIRDNTATKQRLTAEQLSEIPAASRLEDILVQEPGVQIGGRDAYGQSLRIRGGRMGEEAMVVDGMMVRNYTANPFAGGQGWIFEIELGSRSEDATPLEFSTASIEQVDIITGGFQAEYGQAQSGIVNIVTKEGGPQFQGGVRFTTDQQNPRTSDYGYNQLQVNIGGPMFYIPNLYFFGSGEIQGIADRAATHADEGFRGVNQDFVDRLNEAVRNDSYFGPMQPYSMEKITTGHEFYATQTGKDIPLTPGNPVRLPSNWQDRSQASSKITYSPIKGMKILLTDSWSRNQHSYPPGWSSEGDYYRTGIYSKDDPLAGPLFIHRWERLPNAESVYIPQSYAEKNKTNNFIGGMDWDFYQSADRSGSLQFRFSRFHSVDIGTASPKTGWRRDTFMSWSMHEVPFEIETWPGRDGFEDVEGGLSTLEQYRLYLPDGDTGWKKEVPFDTPFGLNKETAAYYLSYRYLRENQSNYKVDLDFQLNRYNRAKLGYQFTDLDNYTFQANYYATRRDPRNLFAYGPRMYAWYVQNRTDLGDFVFNYGLRYDRYQPIDNWGQRSLDMTGQHVEVRTLSEYSPRFDVAFPVTDRTQLRFSYGVFTQLPQLSFLFGEGSGGARYPANPGGLDFSRTDAYEAGLSQLLSNDMMLDMVAYYRDIEGNVASKQYFRDYIAWDSGMRYREWTNGYVNRDNGNIKGVDFKLQKRFSDNYSLNLLYTLQFSRTTGSAYNTSYFSNIDPATGETFVPPDELTPIDADRTHQLTTQFRYMFPEDFRPGTMANKILKDFQSYATFTIMSGEPLLDRWLEGGIRGYTLTDDPALTRGATGIIGGTNYFRGRWYTNLDLRFTKSFRLRGTRKISFFTEIFNALNRKNHRAYPSGYTYEGYDNVTGGVDLKWSEGLSPYQKARFNADFNGDGVLTVEEAALGQIAYDFMYDTMEKRVWGTARQIRLGVDFRF